MEQPIVFHCEGSDLLGILNAPETPARRGVVFVVADGPQYRVGAQRQFVQLCRSMEDAGLAAIRFDYRGMGDSEGIHRGFEHVDDDIRSAVDALLEHVPSVQEIVLWGECDSAAAVLMYAYQDPRITAISVANPWVRTEEGRAKTMVKHYYRQRLFDRLFWKKVLAGEFDIRGSVRSLRDNITLMLRPKAGPTPDDELSDRQLRELPPPSRLGESLRRFPGRVLLILSGSDWIATEFVEAVAESTLWPKLLSEARVTQHEIADADHSFSKQIWRDQLIAHNREWLGSW